MSLILFYLYTTFFGFRPICFLIHKKLPELKIDLFKPLCSVNGSLVKYLFVCFFFFVITIIKIPVYPFSYKNCLIIFQRKNNCNTARLMYFGSQYFKEKANLTSILFEKKLLFNFIELMDSI